MRPLNPSRAVSSARCGAAMLAIALAACASPARRGTPASGAAADPLGAHPLSPLERRLFDDATDRSLDQLTLLDAALIASGVVGEAALVEWRRRLDRRLDEVVAAVPARGGPRERGRALLETLHAKLLGRYETRTTSLTEVLTEGRYNCVTATILYNHLAQRLGLLTRAVLLPSHVYTLVYTEEGPVEVETTSPHGFDPDRSSREYLRFLVERELHRAHQRLGDGETGQAPGVAPAAEIDDLTLISTILANRALVAAEGGDATLAIALLERAHRLAQPDRAALLRAHEASLVNGLALAAVEAGDHTGALRLIDAVLPGAGDESREVLMHNRYYCVGRLVQDALERGAHADAVALLDAALERDPARDKIRADRTVVYNAWGAALAQQRRFDQAARVIERGLVVSPGDPTLRHNLAVILHNHAVELVRAQDCARARALIERGQALGELADGFAALKKACGA